MLYTELQICFDFTAIQSTGGMMPDKEKDLCVLSIILGGGKGTRLFPLTKVRSKPAVPFGGSLLARNSLLARIVPFAIFALHQWQSGRLKIR